MSSFNYADLMKQNNQPRNSQKASSQKIGFFKLSNDGDSAVVRFSVSKIDELKFAKVHTIKDKQGWKTISCFNEIDSFENNCPLCTAHKEGIENVGKAQNQVFIPVIVSYLDRATGMYSDPQPAIWQKNAYYGAQEINTLLTQYGDLRESLFIINRIGGREKGTKVTYTANYIPEKMAANYNIPADFSAFNDYDPAKHDYWVKTKEEIATFLETGEFPAFKRAEPKVEQEPAMASIHETPVMPFNDVVAQAEALFAAEPAVQPAQPVQPMQAAQPVQPMQAAQEAPQRTFARPSNWNF